MNKVISSWSEEDVSLYGIIHSHPNYSPEPSQEDLQYALKLRENNPFLEVLIFPILLKNEKGDCEIYFYQLIDDVFAKINIETL